MTAPHIFTPQEAQERDDRERRIRALAAREALRGDPNCQCTSCFLLQRLDEVRALIATEPERIAAAKRAAVVKELEEAHDALVEGCFASAAEVLWTRIQALQDGAPL